MASFAMGHFRVPFQSLSLAISRRLDQIRRNAILAPGQFSGVVERHRVLDVA
jgi:hypothetical protein